MLSAHGFQNRNTYPLPFLQTRPESSNLRVTSMCKCRLARVHRPGNPLRAFREQNTRHAARDAPHTRPRGNPRVPNSTRTCLHFNRPRDGLFRNAGCSRTGIPPRRHAREGRSQNAERASYVASRGTGTVNQTTSCGPPGSLLVSPARIGPSISTHALTHPMTLVFRTHFNTLAPLIHFTTHSGTITSGICATTINPGVSIPPKLRVYPFTALICSTLFGPTRLTSSRSASRERIFSLRS